MVLDVGQALQLKTGAAAAVRIVLSSLKEGTVGTSEAAFGQASADGAAWRFLLQVTAS